MIRKLFITLLLVCLAGNAGAKDFYQAVEFGIKADGTTVNTAAIQRAVDFINKKGGGTLFFSVGRYLTGSFELKSNVKIQIGRGAILVCTDSAYDVQGTDGKNALIYANGAENIGITGTGSLDGNAVRLQKAIDDQVQKGHIADGKAYLPSLIALKNCKNVKISELTLQNACEDAIDLKGCSKVEIADLFVMNGKSPVAALKLSGCKNVTAKKNYIQAAKAIESDGTSSGLSFTDCINAQGEKVDVQK